MRSYVRLSPTIGHRLVQTQHKTGNPVNLPYSNPSPTMFFSNCGFEYPRIILCIAFCQPWYAVLRNHGLSPPVYTQCDIRLYGFSLANCSFANHVFFHERNPHGYQGIAVLPN